MRSILSTFVALAMSSFTCFFVFWFLPRHLLFFKFLKFPFAHFTKNENFVLAFIGVIAFSFFYLIRFASPEKDKKEDLKFRLLIMSVAVCVLLIVLFPHIKRIIYG